jgi:hypothetical protein
MAFSRLAMYIYVMSVLVDVRVKEVMNNTIPLFEKERLYTRYSSCGHSLSLNVEDTESQAF